MDKAGRPYIEHVARVAASVSDDPEAEAVAWLHDVLEDAPDYWEQASRLVYQRQQAAIVKLSRQFASSTDGYYYAIRADPLALRVKLADIADNADEARLALLDDKTAARLRRKYAKARQMLEVPDGAAEKIPRSSSASRRPGSGAPLVHCPSIGQANHIQ